IGSSWRGNPGCRLPSATAYSIFRRHLFHFGEPRLEHDIGNKALTPLILVCVKIGIIFIAPTTDQAIRFIMKLLRIVGSDPEAQSVIARPFRTDNKAKQEG